MFLSDAEFMLGHSCDPPGFRESFRHMAGLVPAIHGFVAAETERRGCPATQTSLRSLRKLDCVPGMTNQYVFPPR
jgi:hypothetical protein